MLTGRPPFAGETVTDTLAAVLKNEPDLNALPPETRPAIRKLLRRCLQRDRNNRLQSIGDARIEIEECLSEAETPLLTETPARPPRSRALPWMAAIAILSTASAIYAFVSRATPAHQPSVTLSLIPPENVSHLAISPDGLRIAMVFSSLSGESVLAVRSLDSLAVQVLTGADNTATPFWSPDSRFIGLFAAGQLKKINASGGTPIDLCNVSVSSGGGLWTAAGEILFPTARGLYRVSDQGGTPQLVISASESEYQLHSPSLLPDGRHFLYTAIPAEPDAGGIYVGSLDSNEKVRILADRSNARYVKGPSGKGYLLYWRNGGVVAHPFDAAARKVSGNPVTVADQVNYYENYSDADFSVSDTGVLTYLSTGARTYQLNWFDRNGRQLGTVGDPALSLPVQFHFQPSISPDGKLVAVDLIDPSTKNNDLWTIDLARNVSSRFTFEPSDEGRPVWSPDGAWIAFDRRANSTAYREIYIKPVGGAGKEKRILAVGGSTVVPMDWSSDGRLLLFLQNDPKTKQDLWVLPDPAGEGDKKPVPFAQSKFNENNGAFSPDAKWIAYHSDETGKYQIYVQPYPPSGSKWQISKDGGTQPRWRKDGKELFYLDPEARITSVEIKLGKSVEAGIPKALFPTRLNRRMGYSITGDGQHFLVPDVTGPIDSASASPVVVMNWTAGLQK